MWKRRQWIHSLQCVSVCTHQENGEMCADINPGFMCNATVIDVHFLFSWFKHTLKISLYKIFSRFELQFVSVLWLTLNPCSDSKTLHLEEQSLKHTRHTFRMSPQTSPGGSLFEDVFSSSSANTPTHLHWNTCALCAAPWSCPNRRKRLLKELEDILQMRSFELHLCPSDNTGWSWLNLRP